MCPGAHRTLHSLSCQSTYPDFKVPQPDSHNTSPYKSKSGLTRLMAAAGYSWKGLKAAVRHEAAFRQELGLVIVLTPFAFLLSRSRVDLFMLIGSLFLVLVVELLNSAIEALADAISLEHHTLLGRAKDLGSAAVFLTVLFATLVWVSIILINLFSWP